MNLPGIQKSIPVQPFTKQLRWCCVARCTLLFLFRPFYFVHACGVRVVLEDHATFLHLQVASLHLKTVDLSVRFIHSRFVQSFLAEAARGAKRLLIKIVSSPTLPRLKNKEFRLKLKVVFLYSGVYIYIH